jgi:hypothetical protein
MFLKKSQAACPNVRKRACDDGAGIITAFAGILAKLGCADLMLIYNRGHFCRGQIGDIIKEARQ